MPHRQPGEISVSQAIAEAPEQALSLADMARQRRARGLGLDRCDTRREWVPDAGTWCYHSHIAISGQSLDRFNWLVEVFYGAAALQSQPWYPEFKGGESMPCTDRPAAGIEKHQLCLGAFDLGMPTPRAYRQLVSLARPDAHTAVLVARSTTTGPASEPGTPMAYTLNPNGEVFHWQEGALHWHHICCTPGAGLLPGLLDRWLINALRFLGLDRQERDTYRREAEQLRDWLQSPQPESQLFHSAAD